MKLTRSLLAPVSLLTAALLLTPFSSSRAEESASSVKSYLIQKLEKVKAASEDFVKNSGAYAALVKENGGTLESAYKAEPKKMEKLVAKMQENYKAIDSFGYETVEGIVAGVPSLAEYDIYLDAGVPQSEGPDGVSPVVLVLENGEKIDKQGALFTYIIEPALWGRGQALGIAGGRRQENPAVTGVKITS